jgi:very-short-patch-repair endonuclease
MPIPKDPEKAAEWRRKQSESHKGQVSWNKGVPMTEAQRAKNSESHKGLSVWNKGIPMSDEQKRKLAATHLGKPPVNKGIPMTEEQKAKISATKMGSKASDKTRNKMSSTQKARYANGYSMSEEARKRVGDTHRGMEHTPETKERLSRAGKGRLPPITGKKHTPEARAKMSRATNAQWERWTEEQRAAKVKVLQESARDITNSWIENAYAQRLDAQGVVYERQKHIGWYVVDFYIEAENKIVEVNGCYWHACEQCRYKLESAEQKREKDRKRYEYLRRKGYTVEIVWEHDLPAKPYKRPSKQVGNQP